jgi:hypothetical protein
MDYKCKNCHCESHCSAPCPACHNDVCHKCDCEKCNPEPNIKQEEWPWQDSGIESGF